MFASRDSDSKEGATRCKRRPNTDEIRALIQEVTGAANESQDGSVISRSQEAVRDAMAKFRQQVYERAIQLRSQVAQAASSRPRTPKEGDQERTDTAKVSKK